MNISYRQTPIGRIGITEEDGLITGLLFEGEAAPGDALTVETALLVEAFRQLELYLAGGLRDFDLPLAKRRADFSQAVDDALTRIPYGKTASYKDIAGAIGNPNAARAVGQACRTNPLPLFVPCHRVVGSGEHVTGYRGGITLQNRLLIIEASGVKSPDSD
jgi:methylated-DNA-[protein]-cysteine S-methyltransferase